MIVHVDSDLSDNTILKGYMGQAAYICPKQGFRFLDVHGTTDYCGHPRVSSGRQDVCRIFINILSKCWWHDIFIFEFFLQLLNIFQPKNRNRMTHFGIFKLFNI